jgi:toxin ParE1/3/4
MRLDWTRRAARELEEKADWLAVNRPGASAPFLKRIRGAVQELRRFPRKGRRPPGVPDEPVREIIVGTYRVVYLPEEARILVVTLKHRSEEMTEADIRSELPGSG